MYWNLLKSVAAKYGINFDAFIENDLRLVSTEIFVSVIKNRTVLYPALKKIQAQSIVVGRIRKDLFTAFVYDRQTSGGFGYGRRTQ